MESNQNERFLRVYRYFRGMAFEEDKNLLGLSMRETESLGYKALKKHPCHTYMSFLLSELTDREIDQYLVD